MIMKANKKQKWYGALGTCFLVMRCNQKSICLQDICVGCRLARQQMMNSDLHMCHGIGVSNSPIATTH